MHHLTPCDRCHRHVRARDLACPFCGHALAHDRPAPALPAERLTRAALFAFGAVVASPACASHDAPPPATPRPPVVTVTTAQPQPQPQRPPQTQTPPQDLSAVPAYGAPAPMPEPVAPVATRYGAPPRPR